MTMEKKDVEPKQPASLTVGKHDTAVSVEDLPEVDRSGDPPSLYVTKDDNVVHVDAPPTE